MRIVGRGEGALEPRMLVGGVVGDDVNQHLQAQLMRVLDEPVEVREGAVLRVHVHVVRDVVAVVLLR